MHHQSARGSVVGVVSVLSCACALAFPSLALATHTSGSISSMGMPNFCSTPTISSLRSGPWSDPTTWSLGRVPTTNDAVHIAPNTDVLYDVVSDAALDCVHVDDDAKLRFKTDANTRMKVGILIVMEMGYLEIGTQASPVNGTITAEIIIADKPLDTAGIDPEQFGTALIGFGKITIHGASKTPTFVRVAQEPLAGATTLFTAQPVTGWQPGDTLVIPDTRHLTLAERNTYIPQLEEVSLASVLGGNQLALVGSLAFDHKGARNGDGVLEYLPHVANLSRNVVIRSENPLGTRGHVMLTERATVDIRYALFKDLGRTKAIECLDSTLFDAAGMVIYIGTNQKGRYALHLHRVMGPVTTPANGYQFTLIGNAVDDSPKWGLVVHDSHFGLVQGNVAYSAIGAGIALEDGNEYQNLIEQNMALNSQGSGEGIESRLAERDFGHEGAGIWSRSPFSTIQNNVVASVRLSGVAFYLGSLGSVTVPLFKGADLSDPLQRRVVNANAQPLQNFTGNEAYGATKTGLTFWYFNGPNTVGQFTAWHTHAFGVLPFYSARITVLDLVVRGHPALLADPKESSLGLRLNQGPYIRDVTVTNADIQGLRVGLNMPAKTALIQGSYLRNYNNAVVNLAQSSRSGDVRGVAFSNVSFNTVNMTPLAQPQRSVSLAFNPGASLPSLLRRDVVKVSNYTFNGASGGDRRLFYLEQDKAFLISKLNLTNEQAWAQLGVAIADEVAPCSTTTPEILGFACPMSDPGVLVVLASRSLTNQPSYTLAYKVDGTLVTEPTPFLLLEGVNQLTRIISLATGDTVLKTFWVTLDTVPPTITLDPSTPTAIGLINAKKFRVNYTFTDNLDGTKTTYKIFTNLPVGDNTLTITAKDKAGNPSNTLTFTVTVDPTIVEVVEDGLCGLGRRRRTGHALEAR